MLDHALAAHAAGLSVLPPKQDGSKRPDATSWTQYQQTRATEEQVRRWYADGRRTGLGVVCGAVSGQLEMFEFEGRAVEEGIQHAFRAVCKAAGLGELLDRIQAGYIERSPSGGFHLLYRVDDGANPSTPLAKRPPTDEEYQQTHDGEMVGLLAAGLEEAEARRRADVTASKPKVLIETKAEGGYSIVAPSNGSVHPAGPYELVAGSFATIATITAEERDELYAVARSLDRCSNSPPSDDRGGSVRQTMEADARQPIVGVGPSPGTDYNTRDGVQKRVVDLLTNNSWTKVYESDGTAYLRRPGKARGNSATVGYNAPGQLIVFTTSTEFDAHPASYSPFGVYAVLEHGGDYSKAAKALYDDGYGERHAEKTDDTNTSTTEAAAATSRPQLPFLRFGDLAAEVDAEGPRTWLLRGIWPHGDYGIHHAAPKAQKSWNTVALAVAVASGTPWLGHVQVDTPGPVIIFWGEGGRGNIVRRIRACAQAAGVIAEDLPIVVCTRAPHLGNIEHLAEMKRAIADIKPALVILDPLYLAAKGAKLGDVYAMGEMLEGPQRIIQRAGASFWVVHHDNRGDAKGAMKSSGAGPAEWGRVIVSASIKGRSVDPETKRTTVVTVLDVVGGEVPDTTLRITRKVWAEDPDDLASPLHVETTVEEGDEAVTGPGGSDLKPAERKLLEALRALGPGQWTSTELVDWIAGEHGHGLKRETASRGLNRLADLDLADSIPQTPGRPSLWFLTEPPAGDRTRDERVTSRDRSHPSGPVTSRVTVTGEVARDRPVILPVGDHRSRDHGSEVTGQPVITGLPNTLPPDQPA